MLKSTEYHHLDYYNDIYLPAGVEVLLTIELFWGCWAPEPRGVELDWAGPADR